MKVKYEDKEYEKFIGTLGQGEGVVHAVHTTEDYPFKIMVQESLTKGAKPGDRVEVAAVKWTQKKKNLITKVIQVFGAEGDEKTEQQTILGKYDIRSNWPDKVVSQSENLNIEITQEEINKRFDFRDRTTITIDPDTAKDFDDAISLKKLNDNQWELGVHIADVTHYLPTDSPMDKEALKRGNSTYLVGRCVPMLPEKLSNGVCSLRPNEEKLTFSAIFHIDEKGRVNYEYITRSIIESDRRYTYVEAQDRIDGKVEDEYSDMIKTLHGISNSLRSERKRNGSVSFESTIRNIILDDNARPIDIVTEDASEAHGLIEELMLLANRKVAKFIWDQKRPSIYRVHDKPEKKNLIDLRRFAKSFGYKIDLSNDNTVTNSINGMLKAVQGKPEASIIQQFTIRTMTKARYDSVQGEHYGLGFEWYTHFTSPIRRYSDVMVHRVLGAILTGQKSAQAKRMESIANYVSSTEIASTRAERESRKLKEVQYMENFIGDIFEGVIVGIEGFGVFVELTTNGCRGLILRGDLEALGFKFEFFKFRISKGRKRYKLGDTIFVQLDDADVELKQINFNWYEEKWAEKGQSVHKKETV
ncbi:MAG: VacB/RNase II family 3'-5' exoribonuclease [bacterium]|nr:VacB/RNase II family 3'-5' exoribonuclease [bacterium]